MAESKVAIITGGGAGIGRACAQRFAREGYAVVVADQAVDDGEQAVRALRDQGASALFVETDAAREADNRRMVDAALSAFGRVDALVANAAARHFGPLSDATEEDWDHIVGVNLKGPAFACNAAIEAMPERGDSAIVLVSSGNALVGRADMPLYDATKAALLSLMRSLAVAHSPAGIRVNAVLPGFVVTDFHQRKARAEGRDPEALWQRRTGLRGRPGSPAEIAAAIWFLASPDAVNITGQGLFVDGGTSVTAGRGR